MHFELGDHSKKVMPLQVSGAFHTPLMAPAAEGMRAVLGEASFGAPRMPVVSNVSAAPLSEGDASMAWVACFYIEHNWMLCQFPESFQSRFFAERGYSLAPATLSPGGVG